MKADTVNTHHITVKKNDFVISCLCGKTQGFRTSITISLDSVSDIPESTKWCKGCKRIYESTLKGRM